MGCVKSKRSGSAAQHANSVCRTGGGSKGDGAEKAPLVPPEVGVRVSPALLDYAQRLSEEIVARAVQQWVEVDRRYGDIPYIECDLP